MAREMENAGSKSSRIYSTRGKLKKNLSLKRPILNKLNNPTCFKNYFKIESIRQKPPVTPKHP